MSYHSIVDHLVTLKIIIEECFNNKTNLLCYFVVFRKDFNIVLRTSLQNRLEEIEVPFELRDDTTRLCESILSKFRNMEGWLEEINYKIGVKQGCSLSLTLLGIYIDKLEECLEEAGCVDPILTGIVLNPLLCANDIFLMNKCPYDLDKQLRILKDFYSNTSVNTDKKVMVIK
jgi:hypothetical protein